MKKEGLSEKVSHGVEEVRDRAAEAIGGEGESVFRALGRLADRIDNSERNVSSRLSEVEESVLDGLTDVSHGKRTTWPRRFFWLVVGMSAGLGVAMNFPDKLKEMRKQLSR